MTNEIRADQVFGLHLPPITEAISGLVIFITHKAPSPSAVVQFNTAVQAISDSVQNQAGHDEYVLRYLTGVVWDGLSYNRWPWDRDRRTAARTETGMAGGDQR